MLGCEAVVNPDSKVDAVVEFLECEMSNGSGPREGSAREMMVRRIWDL
jgi:hypothetical protein